MTTSRRGRLPAMARAGRPLRRWMSFLGLAVMTLGCSRRTLEMPSATMEPTISAGSSVTVDFGAYDSVRPSRFDIVAFEPPSLLQSIFVFRVIGLPGESVRITTHEVLVDGKSLDLAEGLNYAPLPFLKKETTLGPTQFFLLGDNTTHAKDSRYIGPIERNAILGKVVGIKQKTISHTER